MNYVLFVAILLVTVLFMPVFAEDSSHEWKNYLDSYKQYMKDYKEWAHDTINIYKTAWTQSKQTILDLENEKENFASTLKNQQSKYNQEVEYSKTIKKKYATLYDDYDKLIDRYNLLVNDYNSLNNNAQKTNKYAHDLYEEYEQLYENVQEEKKKPKTTIIGGEIQWKFYDSKGNPYSWTMPVETYEKYVQQPRYDDIFIQQIDNGEKTIHVDFTPYVTGNVFNNVIDNVYENSKDEYDFLKEVWYITSDFSTYDKDVGEYPRFALETFSRGSGDCEDTSILLADMLRSSKYTKDWKIQLVYFDIDNPSKSSFSNHVLVYVSNGDWGTYIETTAGTKDWGLQAYENINIRGWYLDV